MTDICEIATLNINGMATPPRIAMLEYFLKKKQEIHIILLQVVTRPVFDDIRGNTRKEGQRLIILNPKL